MKKRIKKHKCVGGLIVTAVILVFLTGCSTTQSIFGWLPLSDYSNKETGLSNKDITSFGVSIRPARGNPDSHYLLAKYYQERGRHKEAIEELEKTISIDLAYVKAYNRMGVSYDKLGNFPRAVAYYKNALALNPELDYVLNNLGYSYILQGRYDEAVKLLKKAVNLNSRNKLYHNNLGLAYAKDYKFEKAIKEFKLTANREISHFNFREMIYEKLLDIGSVKNSVKNLPTRPPFETLVSHVESAGETADIEDLQTCEKRTTGTKKSMRLVFGEPIYGPGLVQEKKMLVFGKPIYGPGLKTSEESLTYRKQTVGSYVRKLFKGFDKGSNKT